VIRLDGGAEISISMDRFMGDYLSSKSPAVKKAKEVE
jgi:hypothetical protein